MKVCLFGGSFDPPHIAHLIVAEFVREAKKFDKIVFVPSRMPPHKQGKLIASPRDRLEMLKRAVKGIPHFEISDIEIKRKKVSYTIDTLKEFKTRYHISAKEITFLMGTDAFQDFGSWKDPEDILRECRVIVASRPEVNLKDVPEKYSSAVNFMDVPEIGVSSQEIRHLVKKGRSIRFLVPDSVRDYIYQKGLYRK